MTKLSNYVKKNAFLAMLACVFGLWLLQLLFAYLAELEYLRDNYRPLDALVYIGYRSVFFFNQFMPTGVLLGAVVGLGLLAKNSELVVMRAAGISVYRIIAWVLQPTWVFVLVMLAVNQWLLPITQQHARYIKYPDTRVSGVYGYWGVEDNLAKDSQTNDKPSARQIVFIEEADLQGNLYGVKRFGFDDGVLTDVMMSPSGVYVGGGYQWQLNNTQTLSLRPHVHTQNHAQTTLTLPIAKDLVHLLTKSPMNMSISELYWHDKLMQHQGNISPPHRLAFWQKLLSPLAMVALVLVACSFVFGSLRSTSLGFRIVLALLVGLLFSYVQDLTGFMALAMNVSPLLMVILPIAISALIGLWLIGQKK